MLNETQQVPFPRPVRLSGGEATMELLVRVDTLPAKGEKAFLIGCSGACVMPVTQWGGNGV
jgi:hypothetical protein